MEHIFNPDLRTFLERHLPPDQVLVLDDHLAVCPECRAALEREAQAGPAFAGLQADFIASETHLEYEQVLGLAEGKKVSAEVEFHATHCGSCAYQVEELRQFVADTAEVSRSSSALQPVARRAQILSWKPRLAWSALAATIILGAGLYWQSSVHTTKSAATLASLRDGDYELSLDESGQLRGAEGLQPDQRQALRTALDSGRLAVKKISAFTAGQQETMLGAPVAPAPFKVISPLNRVVIDDRPTFTWEAMPAATGYRVRVYASGYRKIAESSLIRGTSWQAASALPRGQSYTWTVTAEGPKGEVRSPAPPQPEAEFKVIDAFTAAILGRASSSRGTDHLLLAVLYARAGVIDEARAQLDLLAVQNPGSKLVEQLKASLNQVVPSPIRTNAAQ
ncbi:MAG: hypothetical protein WAL75_01405 [Terracidiphilus sp.]